MNNKTKASRKEEKTKIDKFGFTKKDIELFKEAEKRNCYY